MDYKKFYNQLMNKDFKPKPNTFFTSGEYKNYSEVQVGAVVSTAVDYIRNVLHFDIPQYEIMRRSSVPVFVQYNENGNTAYTDGSKIVMNAANDLVANYKSIYMQHASLQGMLRHETAHILFTDTSVIAKWCKALVYGSMLHQPDNVNTPDGKEIIARDNEVSILRKEDPSKAYFGCHTDITIPYEELGLLEVLGPEGYCRQIIRDGRFVLAGTQELNEPLEKLGR